MPCERIYFGVKFSVTGTGMVPWPQGCQLRDRVRLLNIRSVSKGIEDATPAWSPTEGKCRFDVLARGSD